MNGYFLDILVFVGILAGSVCLQTEGNVVSYFYMLGSLSVMSLYRIGTFLRLILEKMK